MKNIEKFFGEKELCIFHEAKELVPSMSFIEDKDEIFHYNSIINNSFDAPSNFTFPGANPVSLSRQNIKTIYEKDYLAALKTDGVRYILIMTMYKNNPKAIMVNRALKFFEVEVWADIDFFEQETVLDGELVWERKCDSLNLLYLVFDAIKIEGKSCKNFTFSERVNKFHSLIANISSNDSLEVIEQKVLDEKSIVFVNNMHNMKILPKKFVSMTHLEAIWEDRNRLAHRNDGIIFTENVKGIKIGTDYTSYKWKPENTIDVAYNFKSKMIEVRNNKEIVPFTKIILDKKSILSVHFYENKLIQCLFETLHDHDKTQIIECLCKVDNESNCLVLFPVKNREDRTSPNDIKIITATIKNIQESITVEEIINFHKTSDFTSKDNQKKEDINNDSRNTTRRQKRKSTESNESSSVCNERVNTRSRRKNL